MQILIAVMLLALLVFGVASGMQSYASAKQAEATIEVAQVAQVNAWGNLIFIVLMTLGIVFLIVMTVWALYQWKTAGPRRMEGEQPGRRAVHRPQIIDAQPMQAIDMNALIQLEMLRTLREMRGSDPRLPARSETNAPDFLRDL